MNPRYQIEEITSQDETGVVFRGVDAESGAAVAVRRFFPFGAQGGGLEDDEREAYANAVATLGKLRHASLRKVLDGGCDPVDGLPYLVTEWLDGLTLQEMLDRDGPLQPPAALAALAMLFEAGAVLSAQFGRDALWVEAAPEAVGVVESQTGWHLSFRISPWQWLGVEDDGRDLDAAADFAECLMGWTGKVVADAAGGGLGGWIRRLHQREFADLREASAALAALAAAMGETSATGEAAGPAPIRPPMPAPRSMPVMPPRKASRLPMVAVLALVLAVAGLGAWAMFGRGNRKPDQPVATQAAPETAAVEREGAPADKPASTPSAAPARRAAEPPPGPISAGQARVADRLALIQAERAAVEARRERVEREGFHGIADADLLLQRAGQEVVFRGRLARVRFSQSGITMYLEFSEDAPHAEPRAYALRKDLTEGIRPEDLEPLVGSMLEIRGPVGVETIIDVRRPRIRLGGREAITVLEDDGGP